MYSAYIYIHWVADQQSEMDISCNFKLVLLRWSYELRHAQTTWGDSERMSSSLNLTSPLYIHQIALREKQLELFKNKLENTSFRSGFLEHIPIYPPRTVTINYTLSSLTTGGFSHGSIPQTIYRPFVLNLWWRLRPVPQFQQDRLALGLGNVSGLATLNENRGVYTGQPRWVGGLFFFKHVIATGDQGLMVDIDMDRISWAI